MPTFVKLSIFDKQLESAGPLVKTYISKFKAKQKHSAKLSTLARALRLTPNLS